MLETKYTNSVPGPMDKDWMVGEACIANFDLEKKWYRGEVHIMEHRKKNVGNTLWIMAAFLGITKKI